VLIIEEFSQADFDMLKILLECVKDHLLEEGADPNAIRRCYKLMDKVDKGVI
jgi:hypothetical protein